MSSRVVHAHRQGVASFRAASFAAALFHLPIMIRARQVLRGSSAYRLVAAAFLASALGTYAWADDPVTNASPSGDRIERVGFSAPRSLGEDWKIWEDPIVKEFLKGSASDQLMFVRRDQVTTKYAQSHQYTSGAMVRLHLVRSKRAVDTREDLIRMVKEDMSGIAGPGSKVTSLSADPYDYKNTDCVRYEVSVESRTPGFFGSKVTSLVRGWFCRHPSNPAAFLHASTISNQYSDWNNLDAKGEEEVRMFLDQVEFAVLPVRP